MLSGGAFNALLKTLEEPPPHVIFILATTETHKIPATVTSRCQRFEFRRIPVAEIVAPAADAVRARRADGRRRRARTGGAPGHRRAARRRSACSTNWPAAGATITLAQAQDCSARATGAAVQRAGGGAGRRRHRRRRWTLVNARDGCRAPTRASWPGRWWTTCAGCCWCGWATPRWWKRPPRRARCMARQAERLEVPALLRAIRAFNARRQRRRAAAGSRNCRWNWRWWNA